MTTPHLQDGNYKQLLNVTQQLADRISKIEEKILDNSYGWAGMQTNVTRTQTYDANSTSTAELADVLGTLIADLVDTQLIK